VPVRNGERGLAPAGDRPQQAPWPASRADVAANRDVDLSTDLNVLTQAVLTHAALTHPEGTE
jgi:hypothetical protein